MGENITGEINHFLKDHFLLKGDPRTAQIKLTGGEITEILRLLDLIMEGNKSGLGTLNLLCIAAEMLLFNNQKKGLKLALVEELEAHLHPQYQLRLIEYISSHHKNEQFILTTHSITLASKIKLANLIVLKGNEAFPMSSKYTMMRPADYNFLERFLDATKANLFFAKGLIMVEGDAENLLIPAIAQLIGRNLHEYGISVVNVGSTAYKRYVSIFKRKDGKAFNMPIAIVSDLDIRAIEYYDEDSKDRRLPRVWLKNTLIPKLEDISKDVDYDSMSRTFSSPTSFKSEIRKYKTDNFKPVEDTLNRMAEILSEDKQVIINEEILTQIREDKTRRIENDTNTDTIKIFLPKAWTLEYEIANSRLYKLLSTAIDAAHQEEIHPEQEITDEIIMELWNEVNAHYPDGHSPTPKDVYEIFRPLNEGTVSKAVTAQYLAGMIAGDLPPVSNGIIDKNAIKEMIETDENLKYLVNAILHVTN